MFNFDLCCYLSAGWARFFVILAFIFPLVFAFTMRRQYIYRGAEDQKIWRNLKIWVFFLVAAQVLIYLYF